MFNIFSQRFEYFRVVFARLVLRKSYLEKKRCLPTANTLSSLSQVVADYLNYPIGATQRELLGRCPPRTIPTYLSSEDVRRRIRNEIYLSLGWFERVKGIISFWEFFGEFPNLKPENAASACVFGCEETPTDPRGMKEKTEISLGASGAAMRARRGGVCVCGDQRENNPRLIRTWRVPTALYSLLVYKTRKLRLLFLTRGRVIVRKSTFSSCRQLQVSLSTRRENKYLPDE